MEQLQLQIPRWEQLPQIALYMDQVLLVLGDILPPVSAEENPMVTATMINNYVKMKLTPPPEKKKYNREHLAWFLLICLMKQVFSMQEIATLKARLLEQEPLQQGYNRFCAELELRLREPDGQDTPDCDPALSAAIRAVVCKLRTQQFLAAKPAENAEISQ